MYGTKDPRTCQTRDALEILKKYTVVLHRESIFISFCRDPTVSRSIFSRTQDGIRQDRPAFSLSNRISHDKDDHELLQTVTKKPPMSSRN